MPRTSATPPPVTAVERRAAAVSTAAGVAFALLLGTLHLVQPELDPTWRFVSEYALGRAGWLMTAAAVAAVGIVLAAVFPTSTMRTPAVV